MSLFHTVEVSNNFFPNDKFNYIPFELKDKIDDGIYQQFTDRLRNSYKRSTEPRCSIFVLWILFIVFVIGLSIEFKAVEPILTIPFSLGILWSGDDFSKYEEELHNVNIECNKYNFNFRIINHKLCIIIKQ